MSLGSEHSKLRYVYDEEGTKQKILQVIAHIRNEREILFIEGGIPHARRTGQVVQ
jgi:hypothetical protein